MDRRLRRLLGDVAKTFHSLGNLNECAELRRAQHLAVDHIPDAMSGEEAFPDIGLQLLDAQREATILRLDAENDCLHLFTLLYDFRRMLDALGPAQVGDVYQAVDAVFISMKAPKSVRLRTRPSTTVPAG